MTYREYDAKRNDIVNAYNNGEMNLPDLQYELAKLDRDYDSSYPVSTSPIGPSVPRKNGHMPTWMVTR